MAAPRVIETLKEQLEAWGPFMSERWRRHWAATEAKALSRGGRAAVSPATGLSRHTLARGMAALAGTHALPRPSPLGSRRP